MKVIIAGSRNLHGVALVDKAVRASGFKVTEVVSGKAPGIDTSGEHWAEFRGIPIKDFWAKWDDLSKPDAVIRINRKGQKYDARAGFRRNLRMAQYADALIAIWDGKSPGTRDMIKSARKKNLQIYIYRTDDPPEAPQRPVEVIKATK